MPRHDVASRQKTKLRLGLGIFFLALVIPTGVLIRHAYSQLKWEAIHQQRVLAEELATRIDANIHQLILREETRAFTDYAFLYVAGDPRANFLQRSPLSAYPPESPLPGAIGYFQVDTSGHLSTPLLPTDGASTSGYGISIQERKERLTLQSRIREILSVNRLVQASKAKPVLHPTAPSPKLSKEAVLGSAVAGKPMVATPASVPAEEQQEQENLGQAAFDELKIAPPVSRAKKKFDSSSSLERVDDLNLDYKLKDNLASRKSVYPDKSISSTQRRKELSSLPEPQALLKQAAPKPTGVRVHTFESEIDPFEFSVLGSGHFVLFRKVWRDGQRYIQGILLEQQPFLNALLATPFREAAISQMGDLVMAYQGSVVTRVTGVSTEAQSVADTADLKGALLYQTRLSTPLSEMELLFSVTHLPLGASGNLIVWVGLILAMILCSGFFLMYRAGVKQLELTRQQQDFVSAVSHELKTPLTSIRMYGELLREGWATEEKKKTYYDYIFDESERLSRLINNVLQLARLSRNDIKTPLKFVSAADLFQTIQPKITAQVERAGFRLSIECQTEAAPVPVNVDEDYFAQILINLVDNALKFAAKASRKDIEIRCTKSNSGELIFSVRDFGPGVEKQQIKKIFKLFYRAENELTRETIGTGIGLALVRHLAQAMGAQVDVVNREPGAEFRLVFSS